MENNSSQNKTRPINDTQPISRKSNFAPRPIGAVFSDAFLAEQLIFSDENQHHYIVRQLGDDRSHCRVCPNPDCGAIQPPLDHPNLYCTDCGTQLDKQEPTLILIETRTPPYPSINEIIEKKLTHRYIRSPLFAFSENLDGEIRYCRVMPFVQKLEDKPDMWRALDWSAGLAYGLDYLHTNEITFNGNINADNFGMDRDHAVWANFKNCSIQSPTTKETQKKDTKALLAFVYQWLSGKTQFKPQAMFPDPLNNLFQNGLVSPGYANGSELGQAIELTIEQMTTTKAVDYQSGRATDVGRMRSLNQDSLLVIESNRVLQSINNPIGIYVVADGMGGHSAGEVASMTIVNTIARKTYGELLPATLNIKDTIEYEQWLRNAVQEANHEVFKIHQDTGSDLGSTLVAALIVEDKAIIANVGDSRAYLIKKNTITQITTDHSLVERLVATGQITREEARYHHQRNVIYRTMGDDSHVDIDINIFKLEMNDKLLLCSDGLSGMITDEKMLQIVSQSKSPQTACKGLIDAANEAGGDDNITVIIIEIIGSR